MNAVMQEQTEVMQFLTRVVEEQRMVHAYCFYGGSIEEKKKTAFQLAKALNCPERVGCIPCDRCAACAAIEHGNNPDVRCIQPDGNWIKLDTVRALKRDFQYSARPKHTRVVIIEQADALRVEAANALLKFLEEPVSQMVAILLTENIQAVLPTILSRCQRILFRENSSSEGEHPVLGDALRLLSDRKMPEIEEEELRACCSKLILWSRELVCCPADALLSLQDEKFRTWMQAGWTAFMLDICLLWFRDIYRHQLDKAHPLVFHDWKPDCMEMAEQISVEEVLTLMGIIEEARGQLNRNGQPLAILEQVVLRYFA